MQVVILNSAEEVAEYGANVIKAQLKQKTNSVLGLATGSSPVALYQNLIESTKQGEISFKDVTTFNLDEYMGIDGEHPQSYRHFMNDQLFNHVDINLANTNVPNGKSEDPYAACEAYEAHMDQSGGVDLQLLGIGRNGHIGFNEPSSSLASRTRVKTLTPATISDNARYFGPDEFQPYLSITMGIGTIMESQKVLMIATGEGKADAIKATVEGALSASCPASVLQMHEHAIVVIDAAAASKLEHKEFYQYIEGEQQRLVTETGNEDRDYYSK
jgi:glucosamine-6-phosphate deaminase